MCHRKVKDGHLQIKDTQGHIPMYKRALGEGCWAEKLICKDLSLLPFSTPL